MKRQVTQTFMLCGTLLSVAMGCSKGSESEVATKVDCSPQTSLTLTDSDPTADEFLDPHGDEDDSGEAQFYPSSGISGDRICLDKQGNRMNSTSGQLVDEYGIGKTDPKTQKPLLGDGSCQSYINGDETMAGQRAAAKDAENWRAAAAESKAHAKGPNHKCTFTEPPAGRSIQEQMKSRAYNDQEKEAAPGSLGAGVPAPAPADSGRQSSVMTAEELSKLATTFKSQTSDPLPAQNPNQTQSQTQTATTGTVLKTEGAKITREPSGSVSGPGPLFGLTAPK